MLALFIVPDEALTTWWLNSREKQLAHDRITADTVEKTKDVSIIRGLKQAARDKHVWIFFVMHHFHVSLPPEPLRAAMKKSLATNRIVHMITLQKTASSSFRNFLPTLLETLGYNTTITLVITAPPYLLSAIVAIIVGLSSGRYNERAWHLTGLKLTAMVGFILGCATLNTGARMLAAFLFVGANYGVTSITLGWVGITCARTREKRAVALAIVNTGATISQVWAPVSGFDSITTTSVSWENVTTTTTVDLFLCAPVANAHPIVPLARKRLPSVRTAACLQCGHVPDQRAVYLDYAVVTGKRKQADTGSRCEREALLRLLMSSTGFSRNLFAF